MSSTQKLTHVCAQLYTFPLTDGIAVDWVNEKLYWTEATVGEVLVMDIAQRQRIDCYDGSTTRAIAVDPTTRYSDITIMSGETIPGRPN